jgi:hypothetical protein
MHNDGIKCQGDLWLYPYGGNGMPMWWCQRAPDGREGIAEMNTSLDKLPCRTLTAADRCDRCSARALVETELLNGGSLLWCAYHFGLFEVGLKAVGATILVDERSR